MTLRKNQKRIKVPSEAKINYVAWDGYDSSKQPTVLIETQRDAFAKMKGKYSNSMYQPDVYCRINDDFIEIFPPAPYTSVLTVAYTISGIL